MSKDEEPSTPLWSAAIAIGRERLAARDRSRLVGLGLTWFGALIAVEGLRHHAQVTIFTGVAVLLAARGLAVGRRLTVAHVALSFSLVLLAKWFYSDDHLRMTCLVLVCAGIALVLPGPPPLPGTDEQRRQIWSLVEQTARDPLAPFALRTDKSYFFSADQQAAVAYRVRFGTAVVSGDAIGDPASRESALEGFLAHANAEGWRVAGLGVSERDLPLWKSRGFWSVSIGRDVVIDVEHFSMEGRRFRNLRQAVQRTANAGITSEIVAEAHLLPEVRAELEAILNLKRTPDRGFAMILDRPLAGVHPGTVIAVARDRDGRIVAAARYATADDGREVSLDIPWRVPGAPNGADERLVADMITWAQERGGQRLSLAFAAFPDLFAMSDRSAVQATAHWGVHLLDPLIKLESLYRYLRKFHAFDQKRYVVLRRRHVVPAAVTMLVFEFALLGPLTFIPRRNRRAS